MAVFYTVLALLIGWPGRATAQHFLDEDKKITQYVHEVWETQDGLPQNSANALAQDHKGYLWIGTEEGLVRFDGNRTIVFDKMNEPAFQANDIVTLFVASDGTLYAGTRGGGVVRYDGRTFTNIGEAQGLQSPFITSLGEDSSGNIWIGTYGGGLAQLQDTTVTVFGEAAGFAGDFVSDLIVDEAGQHWMGSDLGLFALDAGTFSRATLAPLDSAFITTLFVDSSKRSWVATRTQGLFMLTDTAAVKHDIAFSEGQYINQIYEDNAGNLWLALTQGGLARLSGDGLSRIDRVSQLADAILIFFELDCVGQKLICVI